MTLWQVPVPIHRVGGRGGELRAGRTRGPPPANAHLLPADPVHESELAQRERGAGGQVPEQGLEEADRVEAEVPDERRAPTPRKMVRDLVREILDVGGPAKADRRPGIDERERAPLGLTFRRSDLEVPGGVGRSGAVQEALE